MQHTNLWRDQIPSIASRGARSVAGAAAADTSEAPLDMLATITDEELQQASHTIDVNLDRMSESFHLV